MRFVRWPNRSSGGSSWALRSVLSTVPLPGLVHGSLCDMLPSGPPQLACAALLCTMFGVAACPANPTPQAVDASMADAGVADTKQPDGAVIVFTDVDLELLSDGASVSGGDVAVEEVVALPEPWRVAHTVDPGDEPIALVTLPSGDGGRDQIAVVLVRSSQATGQVVRLQWNQASWETASAVDVGDSPVAIAAGDLDGDGQDELVTANAGYQGAPGVSIIWGGDGVVTTLPAGFRPMDVALIDADEDGHTDLAIADASANQIVVLPHDGSRSFAPAAVQPVPGSPRSVAPMGSGVLLAAGADAGGNAGWMMRLQSIVGGGGVWSPGESVALPGVPSSVSAHPAWSSVAFGTFGGEAGLAVVTAEAVATSSAMTMAPIACSAISADAGTPEHIVCASLTARSLTLQRRDALDQIVGMTSLSEDPPSAIAAGDFDGDAIADDVAVVCETSAKVVVMDRQGDWP